jgi:CRP/FNR family cyclic AMP-dependent transcriptional regulator
MDHSALLSRIPMFEGLTDEDRRVLATSVKERRFSAGQMIINLGDTGSSMFVVADGHVNIHLPGEASRRISLKDISVGEYFGEIALFDDKPRSASALATTDAVLLELDRETLSRYLTQRPASAMTLLRTLATRLRETNEMLSQRAAKNVVQEIESKLTWSQRLADKVAELNGSWTFILFLLGLTALWVVLNAMHLGASKKPDPATGPQAAETATASPPESDTGADTAADSFDPYPYQLFNLALAVLVGLQGPLIVMSQNRQSLKDRATAETDFKVNLKNEVNIETLIRELGEMRSEVNSRLEKIEKGKANAGDGAAA